MPVESVDHFGDSGWARAVRGEAVYAVTRDGVIVSSPLADEHGAAIEWLLSHQPMSVDYAMRHGGYAVVRAGVHLCDGECGDATHPRDGRYSLTFA